MKPIWFKQANKNLQAPQGMTREECGDLYVHTDGKECISLWQLNFWERLSVLFFGRIWLIVLSGQTQPPVMLIAEREIFKEIGYEENR